MLQVLTQTDVRAPATHMHTNRDTHSRTHVTWETEIHTYAWNMHTCATNAPTHAYACTNLNIHNIQVHTPTCASTNAHTHTHTHTRARTTQAHKLVGI